MTPMDDRTAAAAMSAIHADHERWIRTLPDVDETTPDTARNGRGFAILEAQSTEMAPRCWKQPTP